VIQIYYGDHAPPHFHALYAGNMAKIDINALMVIDGHLPGRAAWAGHRMGLTSSEELRRAFAAAANLQRPEKIEPLP
jgi:hypothetical protein